eukprot:Nitzschia sp. Nitz4//scaffold56_size114212//92655//93210//NITZ4_003965-RA/size114212-augustus-gene-0.87-mRNA-1//-1//CDS//3329554751//5977//frame0
MTYISRGRSLTEMIVAVALVCLLLGFVSVLCVGNYYRAKQAMERQKKKRMARLLGLKGVIGVDSPRSDHSTTSTQFNDDEQQQYLLQYSQNEQPQNSHRHQQLPLLQSARRRNVEEGTESLLFDIQDAPPPRAHLMAV